MKKLLCFLPLFIFSTALLQAQSYIPVRNDARLKVKPVVPIKAYGFNLTDVRLLPGSALRNAMDKDAGYLLFLDPNRLLNRFYLNAGLPTKGDKYGGWESESLSGHTLGHYLSAISMMYASTGNAEFKKRADHIVAELSRCQQARGTGYIGAIPGEDSCFAKVARGEIKSGGFDLNGLWSPWYTVHKVMAGLADAYLYTGNPQALKALVGMSDWAATIVNPLTDAQRQKMLRCEFGGMNDVLAMVYAITGNPKYLQLSYKFYDDFVMKPLSEKQDPMPGKHSNTNVPKAIGSATQYELTGNTGDQTIASFFWQTMVHHHSYVIGGNSNYEYCGEPDQLSDRLSDNTCETCNTYNMLKLTRHLFSWNPSATLGDYYERALYNHILASQNPEDGMMCYFVPLRMGAKKQFSDSLNTFTCCVGSGMENHSKYAESIYYEGADGSLYINLYIPSSLNWKAKQLQLVQTTQFPESDTVNLTLSLRTPKTLSLRFRKPSWSPLPEVTINGKAVQSELDENGFVVLRRQWTNKDRIRLRFTRSLHTEAMPDNPNRIAVLYGPLVMAGKLGTSMPDPAYGTPVLLTDDRQISNWIRPVANSAMRFHTVGVGKPSDVELVPFYTVYKEYYSVYWDLFTQADWQARQADYEAEKKRRQEIEQRTIDVFRIGEMQSERDHQLKASENSYVSDAMGVNGREARAGGYFSFDMKVDPQQPNRLLLTYIGDDKDRQFDILVDGRLLQTETLSGGKTGRFYDREYPIPADLLSGKTSITIRIEANHSKTAGRVFGVRIVR